MKRRAWPRRTPVASPARRRRPTLGDRPRVVVAGGHGQCVTVVNPRLSEYADRMVSCDWKMLSPRRRSSSMRCVARDAKRTLCSGPWAERGPDHVPDPKALGSPAKAARAAGSPLRGIHLRMLPVDLSGSVRRPGRVAHDPGRARRRLDTGRGTPRPVAGRPAQRGRPGRGRGGGTDGRSAAQATLSPARRSMVARGLAGREPRARVWDYSRSTAATTPVVSCSSRPCRSGRAHGTRAPDALPRSRPRARAPAT